VDAFGCVGEVAADHVVGRQVRVLVEEVVLGDPHVLEAGTIGRLDELQIFEDHVVLGIGLLIASKRGHIVLDEDSELHEGDTPPVG